MFRYRDEAVAIRNDGIEDVAKYPRPLLIDTPRVGDRNEIVDECADVQPVPAAEFGISSCNTAVGPIGAGQHHSVVVIKFEGGKMSATRRTFYASRDAPVFSPEPFPRILLQSL